MINGHDATVPANANVESETQTEMQQIQIHKLLLQMQEMQTLMKDMQMQEEMQTLMQDAAEMSQFVRFQMSGQILKCGAHSSDNEIHELSFASNVEISSVKVDIIYTCIVVSCWLY